MLLYNNSFIQVFGLGIVQLLKDGLVFETEQTLIFTDWN